MPYYKGKIKKYLHQALREIQENMYKKISQLSAVAWKTEEPVSYENRMTGENQKIEIGEKWGEIWDCAWFNFTGKVPNKAAGEKIVLLVDLNGEGCVFNDKGVPIRGITNVNSTYFGPGEAGKRVIQFLDKAEGGEKVDIWIDAGNNDLFGQYKGNGSLEEASIAICNQEMRQLYYDFYVLKNLMENTSSKKARHHSILQSLKEATFILEDFTREEAKKAREIIAPELNKKGGTPSFNISAIGHAHLDLAWKWPIRETIRKGARTFSTVLELMDRYPDYIFGASQPQLYQWIKEYYPKLYDKITQKIKEGRWKVQGAMWVEADTNLTGGESLVRQLLYGKRFFKKEFNKEVEVLWLPDVFGYSGALPQILKKADVNYFMTIKISWNEHNEFPYHTFYWEGIDGSKILTHMPPEGNYLSYGDPGAAKKTETQFKEKGLSDRALMLFGIGDGGGGPGAEHLENLKREKNLEGIAPIKQETDLDFFKKIEKDSENYKTWRGELYLEKHQGTFTSQARSKKYNRKIELALRELEYISVLALLYANQTYPQKEINKIWKEVLLYQFHDVLPGSSIKRVYDESLARYQQLLEKIEGLTENAYTALIEEMLIEKENDYLISNSLVWDRKEWVKLGQEWSFVEIQGLSQITINSNQNKHKLENVNLKVTQNLLENECLKVEFNEDGAINSIFDKINNKEIIEKGKCANELNIYEDKGDAWDFPIYYDEKPTKSFELKSIDAYIDGPKAVLEQTYSFGDSKLIQKINLFSESFRLDFNTWVDWKECHKMLRTSFPVNIFTREATCDIQFGNIKRPTHRNTSWDMAKYEIPAQKWVDLSQKNYGVTLMNDCKYGYKVYKNVMDLNLLRSTEHPGQNADRAQHEFVYSLFPHKGDFVSGNVAREAHKLNTPLQIFPVKNSTGNIRLNKSLIDIKEENIVVESIKKAEDDNNIIVRLFETYGQETKINLKFNFESIDLDEIYLTNLMEKNQKNLSIENDSTELKFNPFEIHTIKLIFK